MGLILSGNGHVLSRVQRALMRYAHQRAFCALDTLIYIPYTHRQRIVRWSVTGMNDWI